MRFHRLAPALVLLLVAFASPARAEDPRDDIRDVLKAYSVHYNDGAAEALAALYAQDAYWLPAWGEPIQGRKGIGLMYVNLFKHSVRLKRKTLRIDVSGDLAYAVGTYSNAREYSYGSFVLCMRRQPDGQWLIVSDISNKAPARPGSVLLED
jgi:uncharacterized protein (TIGR02246 family)